MVKFKTIPVIFISLLIFSVKCHSHGNGDFFEMVQELRDSIRGYVFFRGSPDYETARAVHNGACRNIFPLLILKPLETEDIAAAVRFAVKYGLEISVRSGGHSYQCLGTKVRQFQCTVVQGVTKLTWRILQISLNSDFMDAFGYVLMRKSVKLFLNDDTE